ncbi:phage tail tube protein [Tabrizicola fusiformis]|uniref:phage tail tube protein n=1 Tax=Tabrizicola sp. SY72 TaxID=2741673 RepID=UPI0015721E1E|nr:hypothetical protein [Tabrizicola sp. SY72]NTT86922.1 hypothetical protein [Tabrizicola sp. SY72]
MAQFWHKKVLLAKIETVYGTDSVPTGGANAILAKNIRLSAMEGSDTSRELDFAWFSAQPTIPAELYQKISFDVELAPSGTAGTAPAWGPLLRACSVAQTISAGTSVTFNPITNAPESATIYLHNDGSRYRLRGSRGTAKFRLSPQGIPYIEFEFHSLWEAPSAQTDAVPTLTAFQKPIIASKTNTPTFTIGGAAMVARDFALDLGNQLERRFLFNADEIIISDRAESLDVSVESQPLGTWNPFAVAAAQGTVAVVVAHGTAAGAIATLTVPTGQVKRPGALQEYQRRTEWPISITPLPSAGNDQWTLVLT